MPDLDYFNTVQIPALKEEFEAAVDDFLAEDSELLELKVHEDCISAALKSHLKAVFGIKTPRGFHVDTNYNKHLRNDKTCRINTAYFVKAHPLCGCRSCKHIHVWQEMPNKSFRPDLIIHQRTNDNWNLLAVEVKKNKICPFDLAKLRSLTLPKSPQYPYGYKLGVFLYFEGLTPKYIWMADGKIL